MEQKLYIKPILIHDEYGGVKPITIHDENGGHECDGSEIMN